MKSVLAAIGLLLCIAAIGEGCHGKPPDADGENKDVGRSKRNVRPAADARKDLSDFFTECMDRKGGPHDIPKMRSAVDLVLRDLKWYETMDESICRGEQDTRECWNNEADGLIKSELLGPLRECLLEYSSGRPLGGFRQKRQSGSDISSRFGPSRRFRPDPPCPQVTDDVYGSCMEEVINSTAGFPSLKDFHWESIAIFLRRHYARCRYHTFVESSGTGRIAYHKTCATHRFQTTSGGFARYASQQCAPFILREAIKDESPLKPKLEECNERFANVTFADEQVGAFAAMSPSEEFRLYGSRGRHNGADIIGYCDPKSNFSSWFNNATIDATGDSELLAEIRKVHPDERICAQPSGIQMRVARNEAPWYTAGNNLNVMSPGKGLQCLNSMQHVNPCENFKVRFCCFANAQQTHSQTTNANGEQTVISETHRYRKTASTVGTCRSSDRWGHWINVDSSPSNGGDYEIFRRYGMPNCDPVAVEGRIRGSRRPYTLAHNNLITEDPKVGIICEEKMQPKERPCRDFEVRFCCKDGRGVVATTLRPVVTKTTPPPPTTTATTFIIIKR